MKNSLLFTLVFLIGLNQVFSQDSFTTEDAGLLASGVQEIKANDNTFDQSLSILKDGLPIELVFEVDITDKKREEQFGTIRVQPY